MRVHFDNVNMIARTGPNVFANRLARALVVGGHDIVESGRDADVSLVFIEPTGAPLASKIVQRLDGIWFKPEEFHTHNVKIKSLYDRADAVIWQSEFDRQMTTRWWGDRSGQVIHNGIDINPVTEFNIAELARIRASYDLVFCCSANWHAQKRLMSNLLLFDHLRKTLNKRACMFVMGSNPDVRTTDPHVFYTGSQTPEVYLQIFSASDWMIHLAWADHCPNVVVEALSQMTPVICSSVGGTKELVGHFGIVLDDVSYNFELFDYDNPPSIDVTQVTSLPAKSELGKPTDIHIGSCVRKYVSLFESLNR